MKERISERFSENIARVRNLSDIYTTNLAGAGAGRRGHSKTDVLRAAVVLLHAALEDLLRSLSYWKLPAAHPDVLAKIPLSTVAPAAKFSLGDLAAHRGKSVEDVITESVNGYLERSNYNNVEEVTRFLASVGVDVASVNMWFPKMTEVMQRRHLIVHRADRDETGGSGNHSVRSIGSAQLKKWINAVEGFGAALLNEIPAV